MSCMENKTVLRTEFSGLKGKSPIDVYSFYLDIIGEPEYKDEYDGVVEYFSYSGKYQPVREYSGNRWGLDLVLHHESDYKTFIEMKTNGVSLSEFDELASEMSVKFGVDKSKIRLISYSWYNGGDEPISFDQ